MKVALYVRVSSEKQDVDLSVTAQLKALREYALRSDHHIVREYVDEAESGRTIHRPVFQEMIAQARQKTAPFGVILVWKLSRFARSREDSIIYKSLLRKQGIQVVSINEPVDNSPTGRMLEGIIEVLDEFYSSNLAQDVTRGMREAVSRGYWVNSGTPYGYRRVQVQDGEKQRVRLEPDETTSAIVRNIFDEALRGKGVKEIAKRLNENGIPSPKGKRWGKGQAHNLLTNEVYTGTLLWGVSGRYHRDAGLPPVRVPNAYPALVDAETFQTIQEALRCRAPRMTAPRRVASPYLLSGLLHCAECGAAMYGAAAKSGKFRYYVCATAYRVGRQACGMTSIPCTKMDKLVLDAIKMIILKEDHVEELIRLTNADLAGSLEQVGERLKVLRDRLTDTDQRLEMLYDALETKRLSMDDLAPRIHDLRERRQLIMRALAESEEIREQGQVEMISREAVLGYLGDLPELLAVGSPGESRTVLRTFVREIVKGRDEATIHYTIPLPAAQVSIPGRVLDIDQEGGAEGTRHYPNS